MTVAAPATAGFDPIAAARETLDERRANVEGEEAAITQRQSEADTARHTVEAGRERDLAPAEAAAFKAIDQPAPQPPRATVPPEFVPKPVIDSKEYQGLAMALLGMALIGGKASHGNWLGVMAPLNGALKGYLEGNQQRADQEFKDYQTKFAAAKAKDEQANKEFQDALESRKLTINEKIAQVKFLSAKWDRQDMRVAADQKSIDKMWEQLNAHRGALSQAEERFDIAVMMQQGATQRAAAGRTAMSNAVTLSPDDIKRRGSLGAHGRQDLAYQGTSSFTDRANRNAISEEITRQLKATGVDDAGAAQLVKTASVRADQMALNDTKRRLAGVERSTNALQNLEPDVIALAKEVEPTGSRWANVTINDLRRKFGDSPKLQQLFVEATALSREHIISVTMPQSAAQMHVSSGELGDKILSGDMPVGQMIGAIRGINNDVAAMKKGLQQIEADLTREMAAPVGAAPGQPPAAGIPSGWSVKEH